MPLPSYVVTWTPSSPTVAWNPTTLDKLGKDEKFLEDLIVSCPELLGLNTLRTGIYGPYKAFQQTALQTPTGRGIFPDIIFFSASGHVILVEVKRCVNPELKDRAVIAQLLDYASSTRSLREDDLAKVFRSTSLQESWVDLVAEWFSEATDAEELATEFINRMNDGEVNLVIACDRAPPGLTAVVAGIAAQSALKFDLDLTEVTPYVVSGDQSDKIVFITSTKLATEIVARTAVTINYKQGETQPSASVSVTSIDEIEEQTRSAHGKIESNKRDWSLDEIDEELKKFAVSTALDLLNFCKQESFNGKFAADGKKLRATFGFFVQFRAIDGRPKKPTMVFNANTIGIYLFLDWISEQLTENSRVQFETRLRQMFGSKIKAVFPKGLNLEWNDIQRNYPSFKELLLWLKEQTYSAGI